MWGVFFGMGKLQRCVSFRRHKRHKTVLCFKYSEGRKVTKTNNCYVKKLNDL